MKNSFYHLPISLLLLITLLFSASISVADEYWEYTFRPGDSIWKIAEQYTTSVTNWAEIQELNRVHQGADRKIQPGTRILIPIRLLKQQPTPAIVIAVDGEVQLTRTDGSNEIIQSGAKLYSGDSVTTIDKQSLRLQFADKSELQVLPNSNVVLDKLSQHKQTGMVDTSIRLNKGSVNTQVEKQKNNSRYQIKTPAAITAVRGTAFRLSSDENEISRTEVTEGTVAVSADKSQQQVEQGYGIIAEKGKPLPEPVKLLPAPEVTIEQIEEKLTVNLSWQSIVGATSYRYQVARDANFNEMLIDNITTDTQVTFNSNHTVQLQTIQLPPGKYYSTVRAIDKNNLQGIDSKTDFNVQALPEKIPAEDDYYWKIIMSIGLLVLLL